MYFKKNDFRYKFFSWCYFLHFFCFSIRCTMKMNDPSMNEHTSSLLYTRIKKKIDDVRVVTTSNKFKKKKRRGKNASLCEICGAYNIPTNVPLEMGNGVKYCLMLAYCVRHTHTHLQTIVCNKFSYTLILSCGGIYQQKHTLTLTHMRSLFFSLYDSIASNLLDSAIWVCIFFSPDIMFCSISDNVCSECT